MVCEIIMCYCDGDPYHLSEMKIRRTNVVVGMSDSLILRNCYNEICRLSSLLLHIPYFGSDILNIEFGLSIYHKLDLLKYSFHIL